MKHFCYFATISNNFIQQLCHYVYIFFVWYSGYGALLQMGFAELFSFFRNVTVTKLFATLMFFFIFWAISRKIDYIHLQWRITDDIGGSALSAGCRPSVCREFDGSHLEKSAAESLASLLSSVIQSGAPYSKHYYPPIHIPLPLFVSPYLGLWLKLLWFRMSFTRVERN